MYPVLVCSYWLSKKSNWAFPENIHTIPMEGFHMLTPPPPSCPLAFGISKMGYPSMPLKFHIETTMR